MHASKWVSTFGKLSKQFSDALSALVIVLTMKISLIHPNVVSKGML